MLLTWANPATPNMMWSEMYENIAPQPCIRCGAQSGNVRWEESAPLEQGWTHPSYPFDSWTSQAMLSFCAEAWGGAAESISSHEPSPSGRGGTVADGGSGPGISVFHRPSSALTGTFTPREKVFLRFAKYWILQLRAGMPFVQNDKKGKCRKWHLKSF